MEHFLYSNYHKFPLKRIFIELKTNCLILMALVRFRTHSLTLLVLCVANSVYHSGSSFLQFDWEGHHQDSYSGEASNFIHLSYLIISNCVYCDSCVPLFYLLPHSSLFGCTCVFNLLENFPLMFGKTVFY